MWLYLCTEIVLRGGFTVSSSAPDSRAFITFSGSGLSASFKAPGIISGTQTYLPMLALKVPCLASKAAILFKRSGGMLGSSLAGMLVLSTFSAFCHPPAVSTNSSVTYGGPVTMRPLKPSSRACLTTSAIGIPPAFSMCMEPGLALTILVR